MTLPLTPHSMAKSTLSTTTPKADKVGESTCASTRRLNHVACVRLQSSGREFQRSFLEHPSSHLSRSVGISSTCQLRKLPLLPHLQNARSSAACYPRNVMLCSRRPDDRFFDQEAWAETLCKNLMAAFRALLGLELDCHDLPADFEGSWRRSRGAVQQTCQK